MTGGSVSPAGFTLGQFDATTERAIAGHYALGVGDRTLQHERLYDLGCVLEERILVAQGAQLGVFPIDEADRWLRRNERVTEASVELPNEPTLSKLPVFIGNELLLQV